MDALLGKLRSNRRRKEMVFTGWSQSSYAMKRRNCRRLLWPPMSHNLQSPDTKTLPEPSEGILRYAKAQLLGLSNVHDMVDHKNILECETLEQPIRSFPPHQRLHTGFGIRILVLSGGEFGDPLFAHFDYTSTEAADLEFDALSYVWGEPSDKRHGYSLNEDINKTKINCDGKDIDMYPNLESALRHVRPLCGTKRVWVDALCINQEDEHERSHQVSLMGKIYGKAKKVIVWLEDRRRSRDYFSTSWTPRTSEPDDEKKLGTQISFAAVCYLVTKWQKERDLVDTPDFSLYLKDTAAKYRYLNKSTTTHEDEVPTWIRHMNDRFSKDDVLSPKTTATKYDSVFWKALARLYASSWFTRLWVVQEVVLASKVVLRLNGAEISWQWLGLAASILRNSFSDVCERLHLSGVYNVYLMYRMSATCGLPPIKPTFVQLLRLTRQFEVSDPRDRVYGLLGMDTTDNDPVNEDLYLPPDYSISTQTLWRKVFWKHMSQRGDISLLNSVQYKAICDGSFSRIETFDDVPVLHPWVGYPDRKLPPSWIPDWDTMYRSTLIPWAVGEFFEASKGMPLALNDRKDNDPNSLCINGVGIDFASHMAPKAGSIAAFALLFEGPLSAFFRTERGLGLLARTVVAERDDNGFLEKDFSQLRADFAANLLKNEGLHKTKFQSRLDFSDDSDEHWYNKTFGDVFSTDPVFKQLLITLASEGESSRFEATASSVCDNRRIFFTMNGFIGIGPDCAQEGDLLCVLSGAQTPFILRPVSGAANEEAMYEEEDYDYDEMDYEEAEYEVERYEDEGKGVKGDLRTVDCQGHSQYVLVGECFVPGLMSGEAVRASEEGTPITGPVPTDSILASISQNCDLKLPDHGWLGWDQPAENTSRISSQEAEQLGLEAQKKTMNEVACQKWFHIL